ncbi:MAG TPA: hypothetical protein VMW91_03220 [Desulfosporosinus sp.]|nr:hypothetical protein [Desulfosporosinus sp.]
MAEHSMHVRSGDAGKSCTGMLCKACGIWSRRLLSEVRVAERDYVVPHVTTIRHKVLEY